MGRRNTTELRAVRATTGDRGSGGEREVKGRRADVAVRNDARRLSERVRFAETSRG